MKQRDNFESQIVELSKRRILRELEKEQAAAAIINNYGGGGGSPVSLREHMASGVTPEPGTPDDEDYFVAIKRQSDANNPKDWSKLVRRFKTKKGEKVPKLEDLF